MQILIVFLFLLFIMKLTEIYLKKAFKLKPAIGIAFFNNTGSDNFAGSDSNDDSDMKIAGKNNQNKSRDDTLDEAAELIKQKENGNVEKARKLGELLSTEIIKIDGESAFGEDKAEDCDLRMQRRLLLAFTACSCVENCISNKIIQRVIVNSFYNCIKLENEQFYEDLKGSGAFSFYYLCVRRGGDVDKCIGKTFAMLCGRENDTVIAELGTALYYRFNDVIQKAITSAEFKKN